MAAKTANLYARIDPETKEQAERILDALGITSSMAINMFYRQIILQKGIPFEARLPYEAPLDMKKLTKEELDKEIEKGYRDMVNGNVRSAASVFSGIRKDYLDEV